MEVVVGHFGYMEYASGSGNAVQFPRKLVSYAREVVARTTKPKVGTAPMQNVSNAIDCALPRLPESSLDSPFPDVRPKPNNEPRGPVADLVQFVNSEMAELGFDDWNVFLGS